MVNERELVKACIKHDRKAQKRLYDVFAGKLYAVALRYIKNKEEAKDVLQESFINIFKNIEKFRFDCPLEAWLKRIVINNSLNYIKKNKRILDDISTIYLMPEPLIEVNQGLENLKLDDLFAIINSLPEGCKIIFNLYAIEGFKQEEIAEKLGVSLGTVKSQYSRAKKLLQELIKKELPAKALDYSILIR